MSIFRPIGQRLSLRAFMAVCVIFYGMPASAQRSPIENPLLPDEGKLPLTAGFNDVDGVGGGGLVPWALITGYGTTDSYGANAHYTAIQLRDFKLRTYGVAVGALDRVEVSAASQTFESTAALDGLSVTQHVYGAKVRLFGDAVYGQDSWIPQTAVGVEVKRNSGISNGAGAGAPGLYSTTQLGARSNSGTDWYVSATKVFLAESVLVNATLRSTKANQLGLLGFGGDLRNDRSIRFEGSVAYIVTRKFAVGAEYRDKPHDLTVDNERAAWDVFAALTLSRHVSLVGAFVNLGSILAPVTGQSRRPKRRVPVLAGRILIRGLTEMILKPSLRILGFAALVIVGSGARAGTSLFDAMGGEATLRTAVDQFADVVEADDRINFTFADTDMTKFKQLLFAQLCNLSGGPCVYGGRDMRMAHQKLKINNAEFNALAEDLYIGLQRAGVPYRLQNKLMAKLAPMQRDIVK